MDASVGGHRPATDTGSSRPRLVQTCRRRRRTALPWRRLPNVRRWYLRQEFRRARTPIRRARREASAGGRGQCSMWSGRLTTPQIGVSSVSWTWRRPGTLHTVIPLPWLDSQPVGESVTFDASDLTFIDSTGVRTLYSLTGPPHNARIVYGTPGRWSGGRSAWSGSPPTPGRHRRRWPSSTWATGSRSRGRVALGARCLSRSRRRVALDTDAVHQPVSL